MALTGSGWLYVLRDSERAGSAIVTLLVDDLDERLAALAMRGIEHGPIETVAGSTRKTWIADPDGNRIHSVSPAEQLAGDCLGWPDHEHATLITQPGPRRLPRPDCCRARGGRGLRRRAPDRARRDAVRGRRSLL